MNSRLLVLASGAAAVSAAAGYGLVVRAGVSAGQRASTSAVRAGIWVANPRRKPGDVDPKKKKNKARG